MKNIKVLLSIALLGLVLISCSAGDEDLIKIGVSPEPHADIIKFIQKDLEADGIKIELVEFSDYIVPNRALASKDTDLNFFQHEPYLKSFAEKDGLDLVSLGGVHIEPMALFSEKFSSPEGMKDGRIAIPNDPVNAGRALLLLEKEGLIKLKDGAGLKATELDIIENPLNLEFKAMESAVLPRVLDELDGAVINGNYALAAGLNPLEDGILIEDGDSPYVNILAARREDKDREDFKKIMEALNSEALRDFLIEEYKGALLPGF